MLVVGCSRSEFFVSDAPTARMVFHTAGCLEPRRASRAGEEGIEVEWMGFSGPDKNRYRKWMRL